VIEFGLNPIMKKTDGSKIYLCDDRFHKIKGHGDVSVNFPNGHVK
jgi:hypothetical protein